MSKKIKTPWPTKAVMQQIYDKHLWGGAEYDFYSGEGSHRPEIVRPYLNAVISFLESHDRPLTVCDLGCGDFNIGKHLVPHAKKYIAVDIVNSLIERNKQTFLNPDLEFLCLDIAKDDLPKADCVILRQVLQHLSNNEILKILGQLSPYRYIILTEHLPNEPFTANHDIISGQGNRTKYSSGVKLTEAPFYFNIKKQTVLNNVVLENQKGRISTLLFTR